MSKYQLVTEASLARVLGKYFETGFIIISAERGCASEKQRDCTEEEEMEQEQKNKKNERAIRQDIREAGFGFVPAFGGFRELVQDKETGDVSFQDNPNPEASFYDKNDEKRPDCIVAPVLILPDINMNKKQKKDLIAYYRQESLPGSGR